MTAFKVKNGLIVGNSTEVSSILDEDNMASDSASALSTQQSIKAYVDTQISAISSTAISEGNSSATIADSGTGSLTVSLDGTNELVINPTTATFTSKVVGNEGFAGQNVQVGVTAAGEIDTSSGDLTLDSASGTTNVTDNMNVTGNILPSADTTYDLGSSSFQWQNIYTGDLHLNNEQRHSGNAVDGTRGNWTVQEGAEDLYIINNNSGKKYKFSLVEMGE